MTRRYEEDISSVLDAEDVPWQLLGGRTVAVTGATGLLGGLVARSLAKRAACGGGDTSVVLLVRDVPKARAQFAGFDHVALVAWDALTGDVPADLTCDFIVHCASNTDSGHMVERPVDTLLTIVEGTRSMLELARRTGARVCFVSSMEVYGTGSPRPLDESCGGALDAMNVRSSYPLAKQLAENLCASYARQFGVDVCVARLAQSFGPGIAPTDRRVFAEFARCCREGADIRLLTDGSKSNMYVYTVDAVRALLLLVARGRAGEAYNVANEETFCSVYEMACMVAKRFGESTRVTRVIDPEASSRYAVGGRICLDTAKVRALGWEPRVGLGEMYERMMDDWEERTAPGEGSAHA